jgi:hypothetical protein
VTGLAGIAVPAPFVCLLASDGDGAQSSDSLGSDGLNHDRIVGVIPNYQTVDDATAATPPLTPKQKWLFFLEETRDPFKYCRRGVAASRRGTVMASRLGTSLAGWGIGNFAAEFWPDIHRKFFQNGFLHRKAPPPPILHR